MTPTRHERISSLFLAARGLPEIERERLLVEASAGDPSLRTEVENLLAKDAEASRAFARPDRLLCPTALEEWETRHLGERVGAYRILEVIGRGGMGVVYRAEQASPRRTVALKVIRPGYLSDSALRRFEYEISVLGRLQNQGIAQIFEAGTAQTPFGIQPYFAMELVEGRALLEYASGKNLDTRQRLELFARVCDAVHYAHQKAVIHRDLKPSNILVDPTGQPKIIDFGVARVTEPEIAVRTLQTSAAELVGTLQYMSPEQCDGVRSEVDVRSDVYSLGVVLYELICGQVPYDVRGLPITQAVRQIREAPPRAPSGLRAGIRGDIEALVLHSMEKDRPARYQSAADLAKDIRQYLAGEPIEASPPRLWSRAVRWIGRHPVLTTASACAVVATLTLGLTALGIYLVALRPDRLLVDSARKTAALESRGGQRLYTWDSGDPGGVLFAEIVDRPSALGGGRVAVIACHVGPRAAKLGGCVRLHDVNDPDHPYWSSESVPLELPPSVPVRPWAAFDIDLVLVEDVLTASPGSEIVVVHHLDPYSQSAIRVFDLSGRLRFEVWHDGGISAVHWIRESRRLVVCGLNSEHRWDERGVDLPDLPNPVVVFALDPEDGHVRRDVFIVQAGRRMDSTLEWYKWLGPVDQLRALRRMVPEFGRSALDQVEGGSVALSIGVWQDADMAIKPYVDFVLDSNAVELARFATDVYKTEFTAGRMPDASRLRLMDYEELPPVLPSLERAIDDRR